MFAMLVEMAEKGHSAKEISEAIGDAGLPKASRNAVIGKSRREGITLKGGFDDKKEKRVLPPKPKRAIKERRTDPEKVSQLDAIFQEAFSNGRSGNVDVFGLTDYMCKWPVEGEGYQTLFCGRSTNVDQPYCEVHSKMAYIRKAEEKLTGRLREIYQSRQFRA